MGEKTAKAGLKQLNNLSDIISVRRNNCELIEKMLRDSEIKLWPISPQADVTLLRYPILTNKKSEILNQSEKSGLNLAGWYNTPVHPLKGNDLKKVDYEVGMCPNAEKLISKLAHIPTDYQLTKQKLKKMIDIIKCYTR